MKHLYIVRHGETEWNVARRMQGRLDSALTDAGRKHADVNGALLKDLGGVELMCVSPSGRTRETAYIVNSYTKAQIDYFDELMERDCGIWSGLTIDEVMEQFPKAWQEREEDPYNHRPPGGENLQDMLKRVHEFLDELFICGYDRIGVITHGVMSRVILKYYLNLSETEANRVRHPNDLVYRLTFNAQDIETHHWISGGEATIGLLQH